MIKVNGVTPTIVTFMTGDKKILRLTFPDPAHIYNPQPRITVEFDDITEIDYLICMLTDAKQKFENSYREQYRVEDCEE